MRKVTGLLFVLLLVFSSTVLAQPGTCEPAGTFRNSRGEVIDCIPGYGDDCLYCTFIVK
ncbi:MAG TPA: hypothetical protein VND45_03525 [Thermoanaerobaculia bacterium]|jgi:hypothetical protein|nr:hypothetical protein [Thermoanaerobaculia bacterium]